MNHIKVQKVMTPYGYEEDYWCIDEKVLPNHLDECITESADEYLKDLGSFMGLCPAWSKELNYKGDVRFVWELIRREDATILPILLCPDDLDFSCIVIVVEVDKTKDFVYWGRVGYVTHKIPYYETEGNVCWFHDLNWCFTRDEYESMVRDFWERATLEHLQNILKQDSNRKISREECACLMTELTFEGKAMLQEHIADYSEILLHILASEMVSEPLLDMLLRYNKTTPMIECYILLIEIMWKKGDEAVQNVVDVTILERLSDADGVWQKFGRFISPEFKQYINQEVLAFNAMMWGVKALE